MPWVRLKNHKPIAGRPLFRELLLICRRINLLKITREPCKLPKVKSGQSTTKTSWSLSGCEHTQLQLKALDSIGLLVLQEFRGLTPNDAWSVLRDQRNLTQHASRPTPRNPKDPGYFIGFVNLGECRSENRGNHPVGVGVLGKEGSQISLFKLSTESELRQLASSTDSKEAPAAKARLAIVSPVFMR